MQARQKEGRFQPDHAPRAPALLVAGLDVPATQPGAHPACSRSGTCIGAIDVDARALGRHGVADPVHGHAHHPVPNDGCTAGRAVKTLVNANEQRSPAGERPQSALNRLL